MTERLAKTTHPHETAHTGKKSSHEAAHTPGKSTRTEHLYAPQDKYNRTPTPAHQRPAVFGEDADAHAVLTKSSTRYQIGSDGVTATVSDKVPAGTRVVINPSVQNLKLAADAKPQEFVLVWAGSFGSAWMLPADILLTPASDATQKSVPTPDEIAAKARTMSAKLKPAEASVKHTKRLVFRTQLTPKQQQEETAHEHILPNQSRANHIGDYYLGNVAPQSSTPWDPTKPDADPHHYQTASGQTRQFYNVSMNLPSANAASVADDIAAPGESFFVEEGTTPKQAPQFKHNVSLFKDESQVKGKTAAQKHADATKPIGHELWVYGFIGMPNPDKAAAQHEPEVPNPHRRGWVPQRDLEAPKKK
jgi:hypothetical protein